MARETDTGPAGDEADFKRALADLIPYLRAFARSLCRDASEADDLAQEALIKAWRARASFEPGTNLKAWVFMILRNHFYSERRKAWRKNEITTENDIERAGPETAAQEASVALAEVREALTHLSEDQREAIILVGAGGFAYEEAAEICGVAVGTIKSRVSRARRSLADLLERGVIHVPSGASQGPALDSLMREASSLASPDRERD